MIQYRFENRFPGMKTFALDGRFSDISRFAVARQIRDALIRGGMALDEEHPDLVICLGGDGSLLRACAARGYTGTFMLLNGGTLGYLSDFRISEWERAVEAILTESATLEALRPLVIEDRNEHHAFAANDVSLIAPVRAINFEIFVDGEKLSDVQGSGFVCSSSLGSTAYSLSLGGPVLLTDNEAFSLTLVAPVRNRVTHPCFNSVVLKSGTILKFRLEQNSKLYRISCDGIDTPHIQGHEIFIYQSKSKEFSIARYRGRSRVKRIAQTFG